MEKYISNSGSVNYKLQQEKIAKQDVYRAFALNSHTVRPEEHKARLVKKKGPIAGFATNVIDTGKDVVELGKALATGKSNDNSLGRLNDLGLKLGGIGIATMLATKKSTTTKGIMEFVGLGTFLASMSLWPKLLIAKPLEARLGFDIQQEYIDAQGRKKRLFLDNQFIPDLYSDEEIDKIADKMGVDKSLPDYKLLTKEKMRTAALQGNTLWMLTAGFSPLLSAMMSNALEKPITDAVIKSNHKKAIAQAGEVEKAIARHINNPRFDVAHKKQLDVLLANAAKAPELDDEFFEKAGEILDPYRIITSTKDADNLNVLENARNSAKDIETALKKLYQNLPGDNRVSIDGIRNFMDKIGFNPAGGAFIIDVDKVKSDSRFVTAMRENNILHGCGVGKDTDVFAEEHKAFKELQTKIKGMEMRKETVPEDMRKALKEAEAVLKNKIGVAPEIVKYGENIAPCTTEQYMKIYAKFFDRVATDFGAGEKDYSVNDLKVILYKIGKEVLPDEYKKFEGADDEIAEKFFGKQCDYLFDGFKMFTEMDVLDGAGEKVTSQLKTPIFYRAVDRDGFLKDIKTLYTVGTRNVSARLDAMTRPINALIGQKYESTYTGYHLKTLDSFMRELNPTMEELAWIRKSDANAAEFLSVGCKKLAQTPEGYARFVREVSAGIQNFESSEVLDAIAKIKKYQFDSSADIENGLNAVFKEDSPFRVFSKVFKLNSNITTWNAKTRNYEEEIIERKGNCAVTPTADKILEVFMDEKIAGVRSTNNRIILCADLERRIDSGLFKEQLLERFANLSDEEYKQAVDTAREVLYHGTMNDVANKFYGKGNGEEAAKLIKVIFGSKMHPDTTMVFNEDLAKAAGESIEQTRRDFMVIFNTAVDKARPFTNIKNVPTTTEVGRVQYAKIGKSTASLFRETASKTFNDKRWMKTFSKLSIAVVLGTLFVQSFFGKAQNEHLYKKQEGANNVK